MIISSAQRGPIRVTLEAYGGALALFSPAQANRARKIAMARGGNYWVAVWLMRRFSKYAYFLGYRASRKWSEKKQRQLGAEAIPYYGLTPPGGGPAAPGYSQVNGAKMKDAVRGATVSSVGISGRESVTIRIPYGHPIPTDKAKAFRMLPQREIQLVAEEIGAELGRIISSSTAVKPGKATAPAVGGPTIRMGGRYTQRKGAGGGRRRRR